MKKIITFLIFTILTEINGFSIPKIKYRVLSPKGFHASMPDEGEITEAQIMIIFSREVLDGSRFLEVNMIRDNKAGQWTYDNKELVLSDADSFEYWLYVDSNNVGYYRSEIIQVQDVMQKKCEESITTVQGQNVCKNTLVFSEEFDDNLKKWNYETRFPLDSRDAEFVVYEKRSETSFIRNNNLIIKPEILTNILDFDDERIRVGEYNLGDDCSPTENNLNECERKAQYGRIIPPVSSASLNTKDKFSFKYGRLEIRAKLPIGDWIYPRIQLQPADCSYNGSEHLKIAFIRSNQFLEEGGIQVGGTRLYGGAILTRNPLYKETWLKHKQFSSHLGKNFHIYELIWNQTEIKLLCDGLLYGTINTNLRNSAINLNVTEANSWSTNQQLAPFDKELSLTIGVGVGGMSYFKDSFKNGLRRNMKPWKNTDPKGEFKFYMDRHNWLSTWTAPSLEIDYIKVYSI